MRALRRTICVSVFASLAVLAWSQAISTSQIQGTVQDASGAAVPSADIKVTQTDTGLVRNAMSSADGTYVLTNLPIGPYRLEVTKQGFSTYVQTGIVLQVATNPTIDVTLKVGGVNEQVQVEANAAMVETQATGIGQVMENQRILELPLNGRNAADLIQLTPGTVLAGTSSSRSFQGAQGGEAIAVAGGQSWGTTFLLDGALHNNPYDNLNLPLPFPDALQEFKVETSSLTAQNGVHSGAAVNAVTRSGTNEFHGDLFEFLRNGDLNGRNAFAAKRDSLKRNQFGGTVGGPILKDKLFFFLAYQGTNTRQDPASATPAFVPTAQMLSGDWTAYASPTCQGRQLTLPSPFAGNQINPSLFSSAAVAIATKYLPKPINACGQVNYGIITDSNEKQGIGRFDYQLSSKQSIFGRYMATTYAQPVPFALDPSNILVTALGGRDNLAQAVVFGDTYLVSTTMVNSFRATVNRTAIARISVPDFGPADVGINAYSYTPNYMLLTVTGGFNIGNGVESNSTFRTTTFQINDDYSWVKGAHTIAFGVDAAQWRSNSYANVRSPGTYTFSGGVTAPGSPGLADFMLGNLSLLDQAEPNDLIMREWYFGAYAQDTWKVTSRLTLNYGVRWEPYFPQQLPNGAIYNFNMQRYLAGTKSSIYTNAPAGFYYPGDPGFPDHSGMNANYKNFAPRVGLAWDPKGDGRMTIRASWGMAYDFANGQFNINTAIAPPFGDEVRPTPVAGINSFQNPYAGFPGGNPFPVAASGASAYFPPYAPYLSNTYNEKTTAVNMWNLTVQKQIGSSWLLSGSYIGNEAAHLWGTYAGNPVQFLGLGPCTLPIIGAQATCSTTANYNYRRLLTLLNPTASQGIGYMDFYDDGLTSSYNGMTLAVNKRLSRGVSFNANYTWGHCLSDDRQNYGGGTPNVGFNYLNSANRAFDKGNCTFDRRNIFNFTAVAQVPRFENSLLRRVVSGWQAAGIVRVASGVPLNLTTGTDRSLTDITAVERPNQVLTNVYGSGLQYLNLAAFAQPALGTISNISPGTVTAPGYSQIDLAISRTFAIHERYKLDIRGEAFNIPNSMRAGCPTGSATCTGTNFVGSVLATTATFGRVTAALDPRIVQLSMKFIF